MPSDQHLSDSQFDQDGFPITIGFAPAGDALDAKLAAADGLEGNEANAEHDNDREPSEKSAAADQEPLTGYELVTDMMRRQDEVLGQLDNLNARIELAIKEISAARKCEIEALEAQRQMLENDDQAKHLKAA